MEKNNSIFQEDVKHINAVDFIPWEKFRDKTLFITGATGLIGSTVINALNYVNDQRGLNLTILALVRDLQRAEEKFDAILESGMLKLLKGSVEDLDENFIKHMPSVDFVIHGASQTASKEFVDHAVETIKTTLIGTMNTLELAKVKAAEGYVYLSSMEMYGYPRKGHRVTEDEAGAMTPLECRNSYPISKLMSESMCCAYASEYHVPAKIVRLTQTFGPGFDYNDSRIFAYFIRCAIEKKNIVLKTKGETERCYLYTADAATAILTILLQGQAGQAYNAANEETYCSIIDMAERVALGAGIEVHTELQEHKKNGYLDTLCMKLNTDLLKALGWKPITGTDTIGKMYQKVIDYNLYENICNNA